MSESPVRMSSIFADQVRKKDGMDRMESKDDDDGVVDSWLRCRSAKGFTVLEEFGRG